MGYAIADLFKKKPDYAKQAEQQEAARQAAIKQGTTSIDSAFKGFDDSFYNKRAQAYLDFAMPQYANQYANTQAQIGFGLENKGQRRSGTAQKQWSDLARAKDTAQQGIVDAAIGQANDTRLQVAGAKNNLLNTLYQSADPAGAASAATSTAASFRQPSTFAPLANQFSGLVNQYYMSQVLNQQRQPTVQGTTYGSAFAPLPSSNMSVSGY